MLKISKHNKFNDVLLINVDTFEDERGWMSRIADNYIFKEYKIPINFQQISHSHTKKAGVLRGMFVSLPPYQEAKIVRIINGKMQWILVDVRPESRTYGDFSEILLDGKKGNAFFAPKGFAHGCLCLLDNTDLILMADQPFNAKHSTGFLWNDDQLQIGWRLNEIKIEQPIISNLHSNYPNFAKLSSQIL